MNSNSNSNHNNQSWMIPAADHAPETFNNYMVSRPPGSVLPMPSQHHQQLEQQQRQQSIPLQYHILHQPNHQEQSVSPPAQAHEYDSSKNSKKGSRAVIPSKRAAQNRAAQKAFRQRREQYIKDLETKAKETEDWQEEMDKLRRDNGELRERVATLEHQVAVLSGGDDSERAELERSKANCTPSPNVVESSLATRESPERSMSLPRVSESEAIARKESPSLSSTFVKRSRHESRRLYHEQETVESIDNNHAVDSNESSIPSRAPNSTTGVKSPSYRPTDRTSPLIRNDTRTTLQQAGNAQKRRKLDEPIMGQQQQMGQTPTSNVVDTDFSNDTAAVNPMMQKNTHNHLLISIQQQEHDDFWNHDNANVQQQHLSVDNMRNMMPPPGFGDFDLDLDFDPFFEDEFGSTLTGNNDFLPNANSGQVLDDLFAMLQTRQRPQIPMVPSEDNAELITTTTFERLG